MANSFNFTGRAVQLSLVLGCVLSVISCSSAPIRQSPSSKSGRGKESPNLVRTSTPEPPLPNGPFDTANVTNSSDKERSAYREIYTLFSGGASEAAMGKLKDFEARYPQGALLPQALNIKGLIFLEQKQTLQAQHQFKRALQSNIDRRLRHYVLYNLAAAYAETESYSDSLASLSEIHPESLDPPTRVKVHYLRAQLLHKQGSDLPSAQELIQGIQHVQGPTDANIRLYQIQMDQSLASLTDYSLLETLVRDNKSDALAPSLLFRLASVAIGSGKNALGEAHVHTLQSRFPDSPQAQQANELLSASQRVADVSGRAIGVLLPLTGKFSKVGSQARQGIELAFGKSENVVFEDSGETPEQTIQALDALVKDKGVIAVIGPLLSKGIDQVTQRAQDLGVPLISLAQQPGTPGDNIFQASLTAQQQVAEISKFAFNQLGVRRFAIVYPQGKFGEEYSQSFWNAVETLGGEVVGIESYAPKETDFKQVVDRLSGLFYAESRQRELNELAKKRKDDQISKRNRKTEDYFRLKPIVDYEAVFIPDEARIVGQVLPMFPYRDVENVYFLGISTWNSPLLEQRVGAQGERSYFVDGFFPKSQGSQMAQFTSKYQAAYGSAPSAIEAFSYDAASLVSSLLKSRGGDASRSEMRELISKTKDFPGVTGKITVENGGFVRPLKILTVNKSEIVEAKKINQR